MIRECFYGGGERWRSGGEGMLDCIEFCCVEYIFGHAHCTVVMADYDGRKNASSLTSKPRFV